MLSFNKLINEMIRWYIENRSRESGYATIHLISMGGDFKDFEQSELKNKYPGIEKYLKRGDLIENVDKSGYRSDGVYMVDGKKNDYGELDFKFVDLNYEYDNYGSPGLQFEGLSQFPLDYWDYNKMNVNRKWISDLNAEPESYWHSEPPAITFYPKRIGMKSEKLNWVEYMEDMYYHIWNFQCRPHIIIGHKEDISNFTVNDEPNYGYPFDVRKENDQELVKIIEENNILPGDIITMYFDTSTK